MGKVLIYGLTVMYIQDNGKIVKERVKAIINGLMVISMKDHGNKIKEMVGE